LHPYLKVEYKNIMGKLSSFLISESLNNRQIIALHKFNQFFKHEVTNEISKALYSQWNKAIKTLPKISKSKAEEISFTNPKAVSEYEVSDNPVKLMAASELGRTAETNTSIKIPMILSGAEQHIAIKALFDITQDVFSKTIDQWSDAFMFERNGKMKTEFKVRRDARSVRLSLVTDNGGVDHETIVYFVTVEHGKIDSKTRSYNLVYLGLPNT
jgi:hypothetical protein